MGTAGINNIQPLIYLRQHTSHNVTPGCALDDDDSNFKACHEALFQHVPLPRERVLTIDSYEDPSLAAQLYEDRLQQVLGR